jgi:ribosomal protein S27AE
MMICAFVVTFPIKWKILEPLQRQEYEFAARYLTLFRGPGLLFGFGMGGAFLLLSMMRLKDVVHEASRNAAAANANTVAQATPICPTCGNPARFVHGEQKWHCDRCAVFL